MQIHGALALALSAGVSMSCAGALGESEPQLDERAAYDRSGAPVIATLVTQHGAITITSAAGHVRYSLPGADGDEKSLSLRELQGYDPELFELLQQATAGGRSLPLDARLIPSDATLGGTPLDASRGGAQRRP